MSNKRLENWELVDARDPYTAPEQVKMKFRGIIYGHDKYEDGTEVLTDLLIEARANIIMTKCGSYLLGEPKKEYKEWYEKTYNKSLVVEKFFSV